MSPTTLDWPIGAPTTGHPSVRHTEARSSDANEGLKDWYPQPFYKEVVTREPDGGQDLPSGEDSSWADLAAQARAAWAAENPF